MEPPAPIPIIQTSINALDWPGQSLRNGAAEIDFDVVSHTQRKVMTEGLVASMFGPHPASGLAAPMIGLGLRLIVASDEDRVLAMANPQVLSTTTETTKTVEANLSLPGVYAEVRRPAGVTVRWRSPFTGKTSEESFSGWMARVIQHELDLLDGRMFTDLVEPAALRRNHQLVATRAAAATAGVFGGSPNRTPPPDVPDLTIVSLPRELTPLTSSVLRHACVPASADHRVLRTLIEAMFDAQYRHNGVGLSAPQVGMNIRLAVVDSKADAPMALINPEILSSSDETSVELESCLSCPGWNGPVERPVAVRLRNHRASGEAYEVVLEGAAARIVQHEIDHLNGTLWPDRTAANEGSTNEDGATQTAAALRALRREESAASRGSVGHSQRRRATGKRGRR